MNQKDVDYVVDYWADWLVDAVAFSIQDRRFLRGEPEEDKLATEAIMINAKKAIRNAIDKVQSGSSR